MRYLLAISILLTTMGFGLPGIDDAIPNLYQLRNGIFTSGQPSDSGFRQLADMGFKSVINVLPDAECIPGEPGRVTPTGMKYYRLPFDPQNLDLGTVHEFAKLLTTAREPMLIHCSTGNHVGGLWLAYRVLVEHASLPVAIQEGRRIGMKPGMEKSVLTWLANSGSFLAMRGKGN
jgi:uncharacterized protein (TIGR01244 family)